MLDFKVNIMRLLMGASLVLSLLLASNEVSDSTFLFCLKPSDKPLSIEREGSSFNVDNNNLNRALHDVGILNIEPWISSATDRDRHKDIYLNRIYRVYIDSNRNNVKNAMLSLDVVLPLLRTDSKSVIKENLLI